MKPLTLPAIPTYKHLALKIFDGFVDSFNDAKETVELKDGSRWALHNSMNFICVRPPIQNAYKFNHLLLAFVNKYGDKKFMIQLQTGSQKMFSNYPQIIKAHLDIARVNHIVEELKG